MKEMRAGLITGGIGYIGSHSAVLLLERDYRVIILDILYDCKLNFLQKIRSITLREPVFYEGDIRDCYLLKKIFQECPIDSVIHFAGLKAVAESQADPLKYYIYNISGSISLFRTKLNANVHQLFSRRLQRFMEHLGFLSILRICPPTQSMFMVKIN